MDHPIDQFDSYVAGGLTPDEQAAFEVHVAQCPPCAAALREAESADAELHALFAPTRPTAGFEDRLIASLRSGNPPRVRRSVHPLVRRVAVGLAASIVLGAVGLAGRLAEDAAIPKPGIRQRAAATLLPPRRGAIFDSSTTQPYDSFDSYLLPTDGIEGFGSDNLTPPVGAGVRLGSLQGYRSRSGAPNSGVTMAKPAAYPGTPDVHLSYAQRPNLQRGPVIGNGGGSGEPATATNTGSSVYTLGPTTSVPGSIGKTATALTTITDAPDGTVAKNDGGFIYTNGNRTPAKPADHPAPLPPPAARIPPVLLADDAHVSPPQAPPRAQPVPAVEVIAKPKIIRTGDMDFEVESFDTAVVTITKIVTEEAGFVSTTNSEKLPNGKVKGSVVLRVAPEHLDTLVLKLRGIGDLRTQHITAQDITKEYTDIESKLRAAQVMQERLLDIIKNGKGAVKDLLEAEKQLGIVRENLERLEGEIRYFNHQVALSTLTLTLFERDIRTPAVATETDTVTMAIETEAVVDADAKAKEAVAQAKGRIVNASLTQDTGGKLIATIAAQVPPDAADACVARLRQIDGRIARFDRQRSQSTSNGSAPVDAHAADPVKLKREDVTINLTIYNLASFEPRRWTTAMLVVPSVEEMDRALKEQVRAAGGRVIGSQIGHPRADQTTGRVTFDVPAEKADALMTELRRLGQVLQVNTTEIANAQNATESKRGFDISFGTLSTFAPRERQQIRLASTNVPATFNDLQNALPADARILTSHLAEQDRSQVVGTLEFEIPRSALDGIEQAMQKQGQIVTRVVDHTTDTADTVDSKVRITLTIGSSEQFPARQATDLSVEVADVQKAMDDLQAAAVSAGGRQVDNPAFTQNDNGQTTAQLKFDVPLEQLPALIAKADGMGSRKSRQTSVDALAPEGKLARARLSVTFATPPAPAVSQEGVWAGAMRVLRPSLRWLGIGSILAGAALCVLAACMGVLWGGWRAVKWVRGDSGKGEGAKSVS